MPGRCSSTGSNCRGLIMSTQVLVQSQERQPIVVAFTSHNLEWLDAMRKEFNTRFDQDLSLEHLIEGAIMNEIWKLSREMYMSEEQTFRIGIEGDL
ncbi:MAG: hypothetical protein A4E42_01096 [Methanoregulaceae archaeon PtaU1.Bin222]|nr:MAG: hypothetical protein A4E42_01096 [Methanoregulaceae archaeon PtaU1.Bin222]